MKHFLLRSTLISLITFSSFPAIASRLTTDSAKSTVSITFKQMNVPVKATFKKFTAQIDFDPNTLTSSQANVKLDISSFDLGDPEYNKEVMKKEWFDEKQFPEAHFVTHSITATTGKTAGLQYDVAGKLTIKGKTNAVHFPLIVTKEGTHTIFKGTLPIKRLTYNIGEGEWKDTSMVADEVTIAFNFVTH